jgi:hypothetical protein
LALGAGTLREAGADTTVFFNPAQTAVQVATGTTSDTVSSEGYRFTYSRDKLFTGGTTSVLGRAVRVAWPEGVEAQAVTAGPATSGAKLTIQRDDGGTFDLTALTFRLLANTAGAGGTLEIMPTRGGEDVPEGPFAFDATGYYSSEFSYSTAPNYGGSTVALTNYDGYKLSLYVDFALVGLTLVTPPTNHPPTGVGLTGGAVFENEPAGTPVGSLFTIDPDVGDTFTYALVAGAGSADNGLFAVSGGDLLTTTALNYEARSHYSVRVESTDQGLLSTQAVLGVTVLDVDETPRFLRLEAPGGAGTVLEWSSVTNHLYTLYASTNLWAGFTVVASNLAAAPVSNLYTDAAPRAGLRAWRVTTVP